MSFASPRAHDSLSGRERIPVVHLSGNDPPQQIPRELERHLGGPHRIETSTVNAQQPNRQSPGHAVPDQTVERSMREVARQSSHQRTTELATTSGNLIKPHRCTIRNFKQRPRCLRVQRELGPQQCPHRHPAKGPTQFHDCPYNKAGLGRSGTFTPRFAHIDVRSRRLVCLNCNTTSAFHDDHRNSSISSTSAEEPHRIPTNSLHHVEVTPHILTPPPIPGHRLPAPQVGTRTDQSQATPLLQMREPRQRL